MEFNINEKVRVKLTSEGHAALKQRHIDFWASIGRPNEPYAPPKEDAEGWSEWQLWQLAHDLGHALGMGVRPPFETTIRLVLPAEQKSA